jgi:hypothetical protein
MGWRLLIAVGAAAAEMASLPPAVRGLIDGADEILVVAPALPTQLDWLTSATDRARERADERLGTVLGQLEGAGVRAAGAVGSDDSVDAFRDAIDGFSPDHVLVALRKETAGWQERGLLEDLLVRFGLPLTVFEVPGS